MLLQECEDVLHGGGGGEEICETRCLLCRVLHWVGADLLSVVEKVMNR
jgi:hypothetical protein